MVLILSIMSERNWLDTDPAIFKRISRLTNLFQNFYGKTESITGDPYFICAPGRVEILGSHTDYNQGLTISCNIKNNLLIVGQKNLRMEVNVSSVSEGKIKRVSFDIQDSAQLETIKSAKTSDDSWSNYIKGVCWSFLKNKIPVIGFNAVIESTIPQGAGFGSSAALELGIAHLIQEINRRRISPLKVIKITKEAENKYVGVPCGYLDQATIGLADRNLLLLDHLPRERKPFAFRNLNIDLGDSGLKFVAGYDSESKHSHNIGKYGERKSECRKACKILSKLLARKINSLRDVPKEEFNNTAKKLALKDNIILRRIAHILGENKRVLEFEEALNRKDYQALGRIFSSSGYSGINNYDLSEDSPELRFVYQNMMVKKDEWGVLGIRNMGGGFNATTLAMVYEDSLEGFKKSLSKVYEERYGRSYQFIEFVPAPSVSLFTT